VIELETAAGIVAVTLERDESGAVVRGQMAQPVPTIESFQEPGTLLAALGIEASALPVELYDNGMRHVFVALGSPEDVSQVRPDMSALGVYGRLGANCFAREGSRWKTRVFLPGIGIPEDPATGSAAGPLVCHLARHGWMEWGEEIEISQGAELGRLSVLYARAEGRDGIIDHVTVGGQAVIVARGEFRLPG
jgi:trans-2,3-dihydro-3-hydroxyanthranilate isomerase